MSQRLLLIVTILFLLTALLYQRSMHSHYAYMRAALENEKVYLSKQVKLLEMEIQQQATPADLYAYWKDHEAELEFVEFVASDSKEVPPENKKSSPAKVHVASFQAKSF